MNGRLILSCLVVAMLRTTVGTAAEAPSVFPGKTWATIEPDRVGLDAGRLREFAKQVGGRFR